MSAVQSKIKPVMLYGLLLPVMFACFTANVSAEGQWKDGQQVYEKVCGYCHETNGEIGPVLSGRGLPPAYITAVVRNGLRAMPAFPASFVDDTSLQQVGDFIQALPAADKEEL